MSALMQKVIVVALLAILVGAGAGWWLAAHDRNQAQSALIAEQAISEVLRTGIRDQNLATEALGKARAAADARGALAQQLATANGKRFDSALAKIKDARATTCAEAMPFVNQVLEGIR